MPGGLSAILKQSVFRLAQIWMQFIGLQPLYKGETEWLTCAKLLSAGITREVKLAHPCYPSVVTDEVDCCISSLMTCCCSLQIIVTVACLALKNRNNPAVFDHCCERSQMQEGISAWHSRQKQLMENSDENAELERVSNSWQHHGHWSFWLFLNMLMFYVIIPCGLKNKIKLVWGLLPFNH